MYYTSIRIISMCLRIRLKVFARKYTGYEYWIDVSFSKTVNITRLYRKLFTSSIRWSEMEGFRLYNKSCLFDVCIYGNVQSFSVTMSYANISILSEFDLRLDVKTRRI